MLKDKEIEPKTRTIKDYFESCKNNFVIPAYQREYSWGIYNCDKLWQDIIDQVNMDSENKRSHFFGTIIINCSDDKLELIDGQQRTVTFILLLKALLIRINIAILRTPTNDEVSEQLLDNLRRKRKELISILYNMDEDKVPLKPDENKDSELFNKSPILVSKSLSEKYFDDFRTILKSSNFNSIESKVITRKYKQGENRYTNFYKNFKFFYEKLKQIESDSQIHLVAKTILNECEIIEIKSWDVEQAIEMFNSLNSDGLPLYDSDIISSKMYESANNLKVTDQYIQLWEELKNKIELLEEKNISNINAILTQYMYYLRTIEGETITSSGTADVTTPGLRRYFTQDQKKFIQNPIKMCKDLLKLVNAWQKIQSYPSVKVLTKFNDNAKLFLASYLLRFETEAEITEESLSPVVDSLIKLFSVLELVDIGYSSKPFKMFLFKEEVKLADKKVSLEEIQQDFINHISNNWKKDDLQKEIFDYNGNTLVYLNEYLFAKEHHVPFNIVDACDIEHIMPNSGREHESEEIRKDAGIESIEEFDSIVNKLGNKILLEAKINRGIGNEWFRSKISNSGKISYAKSCYPIALSLANKYKELEKPIWNKDCINNATQKAVTRIINFIFN